MKNNDARGVGMKAHSTVEQFEKMVLVLKNSIECALEALRGEHE